MCTIGSTALVFVFQFLIFCASLIEYDASYQCIHFLSRVVTYFTLKYEFLSHRLHFSYSFWNFTPPHPHIANCTMQIFTQCASYVHSSTSYKWLHQLVGISLHDNSLVFDLICAAYHDPIRPPHMK